jgi:hypothetical protein
MAQLIDSRASPAYMNLLSHPMEPDAFTNRLEVPIPHHGSAQCANQLARKPRLNEPDRPQEAADPRVTPCAME